MQVKTKVHHLQIQEKIMTNIVIFGICQEMHVNGLQNTLPPLSLATSPLVFFVEGITSQVMARPAVTRLTASAFTRMTVTAILVYVPYFMQSSTDHWSNEPERTN